MDHRRPAGFSNAACGTQHEQFDIFRAAVAGELGDLQDLAQEQIRQQAAMPWIIPATGNRATDKPARHSH